MGSSPSPLYQQKNTPFGVLFVGADDRTRTCTLARWNLNPMSLPIPPHPLITSDFYTARHPRWGISPDPQFIRTGEPVLSLVEATIGRPRAANHRPYIPSITAVETFTEVTSPKSNESSCCGAR